MERLEAHARSEGDTAAALNQQVQILTNRLAALETKNLANRLAALEEVVQISPAGVSIQVPGNLVISAGGRIQVTASGILNLTSGAIRPCKRGRTSTSRPAASR